MKRQFNFLALAYNALIIFMVASLFFEPTPVLGAVSLVGGAVTGTALSFMPTGLTMMAIQKQIWLNHIEEEIFKDNSFLKDAANASDNVIGGRAVHIPQSGGSGNIVKNRTVLPAPIRSRTDNDVIYLIDEFTSDPVLIRNIEKNELSYEKRSSVLGEDQDKLKQEVAETMIYNWLNSPVFEAYGATTLPGSNVITTTGDNGDATAPGATGQRKKARLNDLQRMRTKFSQENRWVDGQMHALLTPQDIADMFPAESPTTATYMQMVTEEERRNGIMYKAQGWKIKTRSTVTRVNDAGIILDPNAIGTEGDDEASLFWYKQAVEYAMGDIIFYDDMGNPVYYGDVYSFLVRAGGRARRSDYKGIALLKQAKTV